MEKSDSSAAMQSLLGSYADESDEENAGRISDSDSDTQHSLPSKDVKKEEIPKAKPSKDKVKAFRLVSYGADEEQEDAEERGEEEEEEEDISEMDTSDQQGVVDYDMSMDSLAASQLSRSVQNMKAEEIQIPPEPAGRCSKALQDKVALFLEKKKRLGIEVIDEIQRKKDFRNPSIYEKLIEFCGIDEKGTNFPPDIYDPHLWGKESFYDELAKVQKVEMDKREKERKERTKVEFVTGTAKKLPDAEDKKRKSKWDTHPQVLSGARPTVITTTVTNLPTVSVTVAATGTKTTVISAVGNITKKSKS